MKDFYKVLLNTLLATTTNNFVWFAMTFWVYLETRSVVASSVVGSMFPIFTAIFGVVFGTFVDNHRKKTAMLTSSYITLTAFIFAGIILALVPSKELLQVSNPLFWLFVATVMAGAVAGNLRMIALSTLVTIMVPEDKRDNANGLVGTVNGIGFAITSVFSGLAIAYIGMGGSVVISLILSIAVILHLLTLNFKDSDHTDSVEPSSKIDFSGAIKAVREIDGLSGLIVFAMINNFLAGVFFALMDPYGLELVSVQTWGFVWGFLSVCIIFGGILVSKKGLGKNPLKTLFIANLGMWGIGIIFPLQASIVLLILGMVIYMILIPFVEAAEQTVLQKVVPLPKQGRVFGLAQTAESLASPITALLIGPIAQEIFIPFMTTGKGTELIGDWFGVGTNRGIALVFIIASFIGLIFTLFAFSSSMYKRLTATYAKK